MSEYKESSNFILLIASIIVCGLRYMAILLPHWEIFSLWKSLEEIPQQYCLDFAITIIFIVNTYSILQNKKERTAIMCWTEAISFASIVPAWRYMVDFFCWLEIGEPEELNKIMGNAKEIAKIIIEISLFIVIITTFIWIFRHKGKIKEIIFAVFDAMKKDIFMAQFIVILLFVYFSKPSVFFFIKNRLPSLSGYENKIDIVLTIAFFIALLMILIHYRKKKEALTPAAWVGILLCLIGIVPVQTGISKEISYFLQQSKAEKRFYFIVQLFLLGFMILALLAAFMILVHIYQYIHSVKLKETKFWKICKEELLLGHRKIWFLYFLISLLFIMGAVLVFVKWIGSSNYFIPEYEGMVRKLLQVLGILISAVLFLFFVVVALCQMGVFLMRTLKQMDTLKESNRKRYYITHGISGFLAFIFTFFSWYLLRLSFNKENLLGLTINVFQYFVLPVILMIWYSVFFGIVDMILKRENDESNKIIIQIEKHIYELSYNFINVVFAPFRFLFSYIDILSEAMLEDDNDSRENYREKSDKNPKRKKKQAIERKHIKKKPRKIKVVKKENVKKLGEGKETVKINIIKGKTKEG